MRQGSGEIHVLDSKAESVPLTKVDKVTIERPFFEPAIWIEALWLGEDGRIHHHEVDDLTDWSLDPGF